MLPDRQHNNYIYNTAKAYSTKEVCFFLFQMTTIVFAACMSDPRRRSRKNSQSHLYLCKWERRFGIDLQNCTSQLRDLCRELVKTYICDLSAICSLHLTGEPFSFLTSLRWLSLSYLKFGIEGRPTCVFTASCKERACGVRHTHRARAMSD